MLALKQKLKHHFMKWGDNVSEDNKNYSDFLFSFSTTKFHSFFVSRMNVEESFMDKLQRQSKKKF